MSGNETWHGTINGYANRRCRCGACKTAKRTYQAAILRTDKGKAASKFNTKVWNVAYRELARRHADEFAAIRLQVRAELEAATS